MFYTAYTANKRIHCPNKSGTDTLHCWKLVALPNGTTAFVRDTDKPLYATIQAFADETDIKTIITRCIARDGDLSSLMAKKESSIDLRYFPKNIKEYEEFTRSVKKAYESLPTSFKAKFSSFEEFSKNPDMLTNLFNELVTDIKNKASKPIEKGDSN